MHQKKVASSRIGSRAPFLQCKLHLTLGGSGVLADLARIDEEFRKAWLPYFWPLWAKGYQP